VRRNPQPFINNRNISAWKKIILLALVGAKTDAGMRVGKRPARKKPRMLWFNRFSTSRENGAVHILKPKNRAVFGGITFLSKLPIKIK
jgi:hypothetical protein